MLHLTKVASTTTFAVSLIWFAGCRQEPAPAPPPPAQPAPAADQPAAEKPHATDAKAAKIEAAFASLSAEDRALAEKQEICPVSGEALGTKGTPIKVSVAGNEVFICCVSCQDQLLENPAKHLAKIGLKSAAETLSK